MFGKKYQSLDHKAPKARENLSKGWVTPLLGFAFTTIVSLVLVVLNTRQWRSSESTVIWLNGARSSVAIAVQIISHILGWIQMQGLCKYPYVRAKLNSPAMPPWSSITCCSARN